MKHLAFAAFFAASSLLVPQLYAEDVEEIETEEAVEESEPAGMTENEFLTYRLSAIATVTSILNAKDISSFPNRAASAIENITDELIRVKKEAAGLGGEPMQEAKDALSVIPAMTAIEPKLTEAIKKAKDANCYKSTRLSKALDAFKAQL